MADDFPKQLFRHPGPYGLGRRSYTVAGAADADEEAALLAKGWHPSIAAACEDAAPASIGETQTITAMCDPLDPADPLDHDGNGKKGGSTSGAEDAKAEVQDLREAYTEAVGKKPFAGWGADELRRRIADAEGGEA